MTVTNEKNEKRKQRALLEKNDKMSRGHILFCIMGIVCLVLTFIYSDTAILAMSKGMKLCVGTVIPSLFPFMIVSEIFVASGGASLIGKLLSPLIGRVFGISGEGCVSYILGMLCGFPVGVRSAISFYEQGIIDKSELEHLCTFCNSPSSAFLISAVGSSLLGSKQLGIMLYFSHVITNAFIGIIARFYFLQKGDKTHSELYLCFQNTKRPGVAESVVSAVSKSASGMIYICAFVVFFSSMTPLLTSLCEKLAFPPLVNALLIGAFEMSGGAQAAATLQIAVALPAIAAVTFWSGLSVLFQFVGLVGEHKISLLPYVISKSAGALVCPVVLMTLIRIFV